MPASAPLAPPRIAPRIAPAPAPMPIFSFSPAIPSLCSAWVTVARVVELRLELRGQRLIARADLRDVARCVVDGVLETLDIGARHVRLRGGGTADAETERQDHSEPGKSRQ